MQPQSSVIPGSPSPQFTISSSTPQQYNQLFVAATIAGLGPVLIPVASLSPQTYVVPPATSTQHNNLTVRYSAPAVAATRSHVMSAATPKPNFAGFCKQFQEGQHSVVGNIHRLFMSLLKHGSTYAIDAFERDLQMLLNNKIPLDFKLRERIVSFAQQHQGEERARQLHSQLSNHPILQG